jgi:hypothetical protein
MPWQQMVADVGGELVEHPDTGLMVPAYRFVVVTVERQCGKTTIVLAWLGQRALGWEQPQRMVYSAQTGLDARKKLVEDWSPILEPRKAKLGIRRIMRANGSEAVEFRNGSRIVLMGSGDEAGHGKTVDLGVKDEFFADYDDRRDQALVPAMATKTAAQVLTLSTAGTDSSVPLRRIVDQGRQAVETGQRTGIAYFEFSAPEDADIDDPKTWWENIPALGYTIDEDVIRQARATLPEGEFRRAFLNQWTTTDERLIPAATWDLVNKPDVAPTGQLVLGVDVNPERSAAAIVAAGGGVLEVVEHRPQVGWLVEAMTKIDRAQNRPTWAVDGSGPVSSFVDEMKRANLKVEVLGPKDLIGACGGFYDAVVDRQVSIRRHPSLDAAIAGAAKRAAGDAWAWARKSSSVDISPLVAASVALRVAQGGVESVYEDRGLVSL